jgi:hypothetical protein
MCRYIVVVFLATLMVVAAVVAREYGWTGLLVLLGGELGGGVQPRPGGCS